MRIVHCFFTMDTGGAQVLAVDLLNKLCEDHDTSLIIVNAKYSNSLLDKLNKRVIVFKINREEGSRNPIPFLKLNLLLFKLKPHVIHCHEPDIGKILRAGGGKKIYTIHDVGIPTTLYHHFHRLVAISDAVWQDVANRYNQPIKIVYNGIDASLFTKRTSYKLNNEKIKLVQVSRLMHEKKGQDVLINALQLLKTLYNYDNFSLDFVGDGPSLNYLKEMVNKLGLDEEVKFIGERDRRWLFENLSKYHLLIQPSNYEGFGLTILEGFAAGLPVLASDIEGPAEIISKTKRGFIFKKGDSSSCSEKLNNIFTQYEKGEIGVLMEKTNAITNDTYSIDACTRGYLEEYQELAGQLQKR